MKIYIYFKTRSQNMKWFRDRGKCRPIAICPDCGGQVSIKCFEYYLNIDKMSLEKAWNGAHIIDPVDLVIDSYFTKADIKEHYTEIREQLMVTSKEVSEWLRKRI